MIRLWQKRLAIVALAAVSALLLFFEIIPWRCPIALFTGFPCPTCGFTRAMRKAFHGDFSGAFRLHPLWPLIAVVIALLVVPEAVMFVRGQATYRGRTNVRRMAFGVAVLCFVVWIGRFAFGSAVLVTR